MTASIYDEKNLFSARQVPWMKVGQVIEEPITAQEAMKKCGLDFDVELRVAGFQRSDGKGYVKDASRVAIVQAGTNEKPFGWATSTYEIVQYREAFEFIDEINPMVSAAGGLKNNRQAFMVVKLPEHLEVNVAGDDLHELYVVLRTSHDVTRAVQVFIMPLRGMCMNQLPLKTFGKAKQSWSVRHVKGAQAKLEEAKKVILGIDQYVEEFKEMADKLAAIDLELEEAHSILTNMLPDRPKTAEAVTTIGDLFDHGEQVGEKFHHTGWGLVNAVGEYFDWMRKGGTAESQFTNALQGSTNKWANRTAQTLLRRR